MGPVPFICDLYCKFELSQGYSVLNLFEGGESEGDSLEDKSSGGDNNNLGVCEHPQEVGI